MASDGCAHGAGPVLMMTISTQGSLPRVSASLSAPAASRYSTIRTPRRSAASSIGNSEGTGHLSATDGHAVTLRRARTSRERQSNLFIRCADGFPASPGRHPKQEGNDHDERSLRPVPSARQLGRLHHSHGRNIVRGCEVELVETPSQLHVEGFGERDVTLESSPDSKQDWAGLNRAVRNVKIGKAVFRCAQRTPGRLDLLLHEPELILCLLTL